MKAIHPVCKPENLGFFLAGELQRILDHAIIVQPCRSLDHLQKDNKDRQGPGERNQILQNNYDEPLISNFRPVQDINGRKVDHYQ